MPSKFPSLKIGTLVCVSWDDASSHDEGWAAAEALENRIQACTTVGFVVRRDRKQVLLAMSRGVQGDMTEYATTTAIPTGWITNVAVWK